MDSEFALLGVSAAIMSIAPLLLAQAIAGRRRVSWRLFAIGAATFIGSQIGHIPFNLVTVPAVQEATAGWAPAIGQLTFAIFVGLSAGVFEEGARYLTYRSWATGARTWRQGLMLGAGHGGAEAIALGSMLAINAAVLYALSSGRLELALPREARAAVTEQLQVLAGEPWYGLVLGAVERLFALAIHLALSLLVMQRFVRGRIRWLAAAVGWHAMTNAVAVVALPTWGPYVTEGLIGILALISLGIVAALRNAEPAQVAEGHGAEIMPLTLVRRESTAEEIESSRYA